MLRGYQGLETFEGLGCSDVGPWHMFHGQHIWVYVHELIPKGSRILCVCT